MEENEFTLRRRAGWKATDAEIHAIEDAAAVAIGRTV